MSGGSLEYTYAVFGYVARDLRADVLERREEGEEREAVLHLIDVVSEGLCDAGHDIEWFLSDDHGEETLRQRLRDGKYPDVGVPAPLAGTPRKRDCNAGLLYFAELLEAKLEEESPIYMGGSKDDIPGDLRAWMENVVLFARSAAAALGEAELWMYGDRTDDELREAAAAWPPALRKGGFGPRPGGPAL